MSEIGNKLIESCKQVNRQMMREQFEAWAIGHFINFFDRNILQLDEWGDYVLGNVRMAWTAWQASREAMVVDLPKPYSDHRLASRLERHARASAIHECHAAIEAQGIKVTP